MFLYTGKCIKAEFQKVKRWFTIAGMSAVQSLPLFTRSIHKEFSIADPFPALSFSYKSACTLAARLELLIFDFCDLNKLLK